jgi:hypothetical protein
VRILDTPRARPASPAQQLALAVLEQAVADLRRRRALPRPLALPASLARSRSLVDGVESWFASDDTGWIFSFENVCAMVGIDAEAGREKLGVGRRHALRLRDLRRHAESGLPPRLRTAARLASAD